MATGYTPRPGTAKGRTTIRKGGSLTGLHGPASRQIKLWPFDAQPDTTLAKLARAYFAGLDAVDRIEERTRSNTASGKFTPAGVRDDALKFALSDLVPSLHKARQTIRKAKAEVAERKSKLKVEGPDKTDIAGAIAQQSMYDTDALTVSLPWIIDEVEGTRRLFGPQVWDYSIEGSLPTLNALLAYLDEQRLSKRRMSVDELFAPNISPGLADYLRATGEA